MEVFGLQLLIHVRWLVALGGAAIMAPAGAAAANCEALATLRLPHVILTSARTVAPGRLVLPDADLPRADTSFFTAFDKLPAFCRVQAVSVPSAGSHIEFEVWLPLPGWNGRYVGAGNGGYGGSINYYRLAEAVNAGYVGSSTDTGHRGSAIDGREASIDFDYRAIHETAEQSKAITRAFYGQAPSRSYFHSCSNGGRQALTEAERYPGDYDGISAGAPAFTLRTNRDADVSNPKLKAFKERGGKLLLYHGENDGPAPSITYYQRLVATMGEKAVDEFARFYVIPAMGHCGGGPVPEFGARLWPAAQDSQHSIILALEQWVEQGIGPDAIIATKYRRDEDWSSGVERNRPLCRYPWQAVWTGKGDANDAANYLCNSRR
jgi:pimeloyl-ACP methyl ester carboxylesterase